MTDSELDELVARLRAGHRSWCVPGCTDLRAADAIEQLRRERLTEPQREAVAAWQAVIPEVREQWFDACLSG